MTKGLTTGLVIVDRLLVKLGTSSTDMRSSGPGSPNGRGILSLRDDVPVPSLGVSSEAWLGLKKGLPEISLRVSGVMI